MTKSFKYNSGAFINDITELWGKGYSHCSGTKYKGLNKASILVGEVEEIFLNLRNISCMKSLSKGN